MPTVTHPLQQGHSHSNKAIPTPARPHPLIVPLPGPNILNHHRWDIFIKPLPSRLRDLCGRQIVMVSEVMDDTKAALSTGNYRTDACVNSQGLWQHLDACRRFKTGRAPELKVVDMRFHA